MLLKLEVNNNDGIVVLILVNDVSCPFSLVLIVLLYVVNGRYEPIVLLKLEVNNNDGIVLLILVNDVSCPFSLVVIVLL